MCIRDRYLAAIQEENYDKSFQRHEDMIAGKDADVDMEQLFADAEKLLEDEDGSDGSDLEVGDTPDQSSGTTGGGTELPPTASVPNQG